MHQTEDTPAGEVAVVADVANLVADAPAGDPGTFIDVLVRAGRAYGRAAYKLAFADATAVPAAVRLRLHAAEFQLRDRPSWANGGGRPKRSDDAILMGETLALAHERPALTAFVLGGADADLLSLIAALRRLGRRVALVAGPSLVGRLLPHADLDGCFAQNNGAPLNLGDLLGCAEPGGEEVPVAAPHQTGRNEDLDALVLETVCELAGRFPYVTRTLLIRNGPWADESTMEITQALRRLVEAGELEEYTHLDGGRPLPAIRRAHETGSVNVLELAPWQAALREKGADLALVR